MFVATIRRALRLADDRFCDFNARRWGTKLELLETRPRGNMSLWNFRVLHLAGRGRFEHHRQLRARVMQRMHSVTAALVHISLGETEVGHNGSFEHMSCSICIQ